MKKLMSIAIIMMFTLTACVTIPDNSSDIPEGGLLTQSIQGDWTDVNRGSRMTIDGSDVLMQVNEGMFLGTVDESTQVITMKDFVYVDDVIPTEDIAYTYKIIGDKLVINTDDTEATTPFFTSTVTFEEGNYPLYVEELKEKYQNESNN